MNFRSGALREIQKLYKGYTSYIKGENALFRDHKNRYWMLLGEDT